MIYLFFRIICFWIYLFGDEKRICNGRCWTFRWCLVPRRTIRYLQNHRMDLGRLMASRPATSCYLDTCRAFPNLGEPRKRRGSTGRNGEYIENCWVQKVWDQPPMLHYRMEPLFHWMGSPWWPRRLGSSPCRGPLEALEVEGWERGCPRGLMLWEWAPQKQVLIPRKLT